MKIYNQNIWGNFSDKECIGNRNELIKELISDINPDFCCFQECNPSTSKKGDNSICVLLEKEYSEVLPQYSSKNFTPIFYKKEKFRYLCGDYVVFSGLNDWNSKSFTWAVFEELSTGDKIAVISTHFWWKYTGEEDNLQRRDNAKEIMGIVKYISATFNIPILICGDLNSGHKAKQGPDTYNTMLNYGLKDVRTLLDDYYDADTCSSIYPKHTDTGYYYDGVMPDFTIDYIFIYKDEKIKALNFEVINTQVARDSSDHSPLIFDFEII